MRLLLAFLLLSQMATSATRNGTLSTANDENAVMAPINAMFAGIEAADVNAIRAQLRIGDGGGATVVGSRADGSKIMRHLTWEQNLSFVRPSGHRNVERLVGRPTIEIDGDIAMVWAKFVFSTDGRMTHCGVDHFDLIRDNGKWKIQNLTWSQRTRGCFSLQR